MGLLILWFLGMPDLTNWTGMTGQTEHWAGGQTDRRQEDMGRASKWFRWFWVL